VQDENASLAIYPLPDAILPHLRWLRANQLGPWSAGMGDALDSAARRVNTTSAIPGCRGHVDSVTSVRGGQRLDGWILPPSGTDAGGAFDVVDASGSSDGVGLVGLYRPDVKGVKASSSAFSGFVAYGRAGRGQTDLVMLDRHTAAPLCALDAGGP